MLPSRLRLQNQLATTTTIKPQQTIEIAILALALLTGLPAIAQTNQSVVEDFKPSTLNQPGKQYPQVNSERRVRARVVAPQAQNVVFDFLGGGKYPLTKGEDIHVTYGVVGLKTHCKVILVVRQDHNGLRRYVHIGTGNYHEETAKLYSDIGLLTCDPDIGREIEHQSAGRGGRIIAKMNSLEDPEIVRALYAASAAGVEIDLLVRGVCRLRPGLPGVSENIEVRSIVGRFLEHTRIFSFNNNGDPRVFSFFGGLDDAQF